MKYEISDKCKVLNGSHLKWIAMGSMLMDHANKGLIINYQIIRDSYNPAVVMLSNMLEILGRVAFPIFLYLLVEGFVYTRSRKKYFWQLLIFGVLSEVPYDMFESGTFVDWGGQNMFFELALALLMLCVVEQIRKKLPKWWVFASILPVFIFAYVASYLALDYHYYGIFIPFIFYVFRDKKLIGTILSYLVVLKELWSILGFGLICLYNGERGKINKWIGYWFYPVHLLIIGVLRMYVLKLG